MIWSWLKERMRRNEQKMLMRYAQQDLPLAIANRDHARVRRLKKIIADIREDLE